MSISRAQRSGVNTATSPKKTRSLLDAAGLPSPVLNLSTNVISAAQINLSWSAPFFSGDSAVTGYVVTVTPSAGSVNIVGTSASVTGLSAATTYSFEVRAQNAVGNGAPGSSVSATTTAFNGATGGTETVVSNYNGTGQTWRVHTFTTSGNFTVTAGSQPFSVLLVGGGAGGAGGVGLQSAGGGGAGGRILDTNRTISPGTYAITVGNAGGGGAYNTQGPNGQNTTAFGLTAVGGGGGGRVNTTGSSGGSGGGGGPAAGGGGGTAGQGNNGGGGSGWFGDANNSAGPYGSGGGGGGGIGGAGSSTPGGLPTGGTGGAGSSINISGSPVTYGAGGGGGGVHDFGPGGSGGIGGRGGGG